MEITISEKWKTLLQDQFQSKYFEELTSFLDLEYRNYQVFPPQELIFEAFNHTSPEMVKIVILGQDPYHDDNQAHGLSFSVNDGVKIPPSLANIYKEIEHELGIEPPASGNLTRWARQGVLLLNATLTVRAHQANSHQKIGWEKFTDSVIKSLADNFDNIVFMLWGGNAHKKAAMIDPARHLVLMSAHPSPLSAYRGFFGNGHFSKANDYLSSKGKTEINW
jgi:uracil-DNA glycosylase